MTSNANNLFFPSLTGIRAVAAYMVFLHHTNPFDPDSQKLLFDFVAELHTGVTLFFVLSGFLITYRYYDTRFSFSNYIKNRIARIYPMYFLLTTFTFLAPFLIVGIGNKETYGVYLSNIFFFRGFFDELKFTGIAQGWSLTVEEVFYISAPLFFLLILRKKYMLFLLPIIILGTGFLLVYIFKDVYFYGFYSNFDFMLNYTFTGRCFEFFSGMGLAILIKKEYSFKYRFRYFTYSGAIIILVCILAIGFFKGGNDFGIRTPMGILINTFLLPLAGISLLFYGLIKEETMLKKLLSSPIMIAAGKSSYIFYLIHIGVIKLLVVQYVTSNLALVFLILILISYLLFYLVEEPLNRVIRNTGKMNIN